jgi:hypothetical protein
MLLGLVIIVAGVGLYYSGHLSDGGGGRDHPWLKKIGGALARGGSKAGKAGGRWSWGRLRNLWGKFSGLWKPADTFRACDECGRPVSLADWLDHWLTAHHKQPPDRIRKPTADKDKITKIEDPPAPPKRGKGSPATSGGGTPPTGTAPPTNQPQPAGPAPAGTGPTTEGAGMADIDWLTKRGAEFARGVYDVEIQRVLDFDSLLDTFARVGKLLGDACDQKRQFMVDHQNYDPRAVEGLRNLADAFNEAGTTAHNGQKILRTLPGYRAILDAEQGGVRLPNHQAA